MGVRRFDGNVTAVTNKTHNPALTVVLVGEERKKTRTKVRGVSYGKIGLMTVAVTNLDFLSGMPLVL